MHLQTAVRRGGALAIALLGVVALTPVRASAQAGGIPVTGTLSDPNAILRSAVLSVTSVTLDPNTNQLVASGTLAGVVTTAEGTTRFVQNFTNIPLSLLDPTPGTCEILDLDLGPITIDLLGLVIDLSAIHLDIVAQAGPGNLLGNLLCALVGLLD